MVRAKGRPIDQPIVHKVHRPAFVRPCGGWQGAPRDRGTLAPPALDREPGFAVEPVDPLPVHRIALSAQQHPQASIAPPRPRCGELSTLDRKSTRLNSSHVRISY